MKLPVQSISTVPPTKTQLHVDDIVNVRVPLPEQVDGGEMQLAKGVKSFKLAKAVPPKLGLHPAKADAGHTASVRGVVVPHVGPIAYWME
jgi:hypothetical protein